jgi:hypothetical protein
MMSKKAYSDDVSDDVRNTDRIFRSGAEYPVSLTIKGGKLTRVFSLALVHSLNSARNSMAAAEESAHEISIDEVSGIAFKDDRASVVENTLIRFVVHATTPMPAHLSISRSAASDDRDPRRLRLVLHAYRPAGVSTQVVTKDWLNGWLWCGGFIDDCPATIQLEDHHGRKLAEISVGKDPVVPRAEGPVGPTQLKG